MSLTLSCGGPFTFSQDKMKLLAAGHLCGGYHSNIDRNHNSLSSAQKLVHCFPGKFYVSTMLIRPYNLDPSFRP